jgi:hypothetical protein
MAEISGYTFTDDRDGRVYWPMHMPPNALLPNDIIECMMLTHGEAENDQPVRVWVSGRLLARTIAENHGLWHCSMRILVFDSVRPEQAARAASGQEQASAEGTVRDG